MVPGHQKVDEIRRVLAGEEHSEVRRGWRALVPFRADVAAELRRDLAENALTWHIPSPEELGDALGEEEPTSETLTSSFGEIAAVLDSGEVWVVHSVGDAEPQTLVVGMSFD